MVNKEMVEQMIAATDDIVKAFAEQGLNTLAIMAAKEEMSKAEQEIVLKNPEYGRLGNDLLRKNFLKDILLPMVDRVRELEAEKVPIETCIKIADAKIRCAKYVGNWQAGTQVTMPNDKSVA